MPNEKSIKFNSENQNENDGVGEWMRLHPFRSPTNQAQLIPRSFSSEISALIESCGIREEAL